LANGSAISEKDSSCGIRPEAVATAAPHAGRFAGRDRVAPTPAGCWSTNPSRPAAPVLHAIQWRARLRRQSLRQLLGPELFSAYGNAQTAGTISLLTVERLCDEVLGWHPRMLYGETYDQAAIAPDPRPDGVAPHARSVSAR
jgi:hypothetical protein